MKIWLTQIGENLPVSADVRKMRCAYLAERLRDRGHEVIWWASAFDHMRKEMLFPEDREIDLGRGLRLRALKSRGYRKNISLGRYLDHLLLGEKMAAQFHRSEAPDLIIASMPDHWSACQAVRYAQSRKIPVLVDVRDEWPDIFLNFFPPMLRMVMKHVFASDYRKVRYLLKNATGITSMMEYMLEWALAKAGRERTWRDEVFYLGSRYELPPAGAAVPEKFAGMAGKLNGQCVVAFIGTMGSCYNPRIVVDVARELRGNKDVFFVIAGDGTHFPALREHARGCENVFLPGWITEPEIRFLLSIAHLGVIPCTEEIHTFPNKAYIYLSAGLPILSSVRGELGRLIEERQLGGTYPVDDGGTLRRLVEHLAAHREIRQNMAHNAARIFKERYDAEAIYDRFAEHVEKVAAGEVH